MLKPPNVNPGHDAAVRRMLAVPPQPSTSSAAKPKDKVSRHTRHNSKKSRRNGHGK